MKNVETKKTASGNSQYVVTADMAAPEAQDILSVCIVLADGSIIDNADIPEGYTFRITYPDKKIVLMKKNFAFYFKRALSALFSKKGR